MSKILKRILTVAMIAVMCFTLAISASASYISGYDQYTITATNHAYPVYASIDGWGGMGITVKNTCSQHVLVHLEVYSPDFNDPIINTDMYTDEEIQVNNLFHFSGNPYIIYYENIPSGVSFLSQTWIYG